MNLPHTRILLISLLMAQSLTINSVLANPETRPSKDLMALPLEELLQIKISTVSRKLESANKTAAAVFVITQEDIRRSSANSIPEILRMAPGLSVTRIDVNKWSVTSRRYSGRFADDLLVLIDGRTVYSPFFTETFWGTLDLPNGHFLPNNIELDAFFVISTSYLA